MSNTLMVTATWLIAIAALANVVVYWIISAKIDAQIALAKEQIELTRDLFLESHKPMLSVSIKECGYSEGCLKGRVVIKNHGTEVANQIDLTLGFTTFQEQYNQIAIRPKEKLKYALRPVPMTLDQYNAGAIDGNRISVQIYGSYKGIAEQSYPYNEMQQYQPNLGRFAPVKAW